MKRTLAFVGAAVAISCGPQVDLRSAVQIENVSTRWIDAGVVGGQHKIVPAASFTLKNRSNSLLVPVQVNAVFRQVDNPAEWSSVFMPGAARELPSGGSTATLHVQGEKGYTSGDLPAAMLAHARFVDAKVEIYGKSGAANWIKLGDFPVARQLSAPQ